MGIAESWRAVSVDTVDDPLHPVDPPGSGSGRRNRQAFYLNTSAGRRARLPEEPLPGIVDARQILPQRDRERKMAEDHAYILNQRAESGRCTSGIVGTDVLGAHVGDPFDDMHLIDIAQQGEQVVGMINRRRAHPLLS